MARSGRRGRFGVRAMLLGVAVAAAISAALLNWLPTIQRRRRVDSLVEAQYRSLLDPGAAPTQSFGRLAERRPADLATLQSSSRDVARRLLRMVEAPGDPSAGLPLEWKPPAYLPGVWAADRLAEWVVVADDFELGREATAGLFDLAADGRLRPEVETAALTVLLLELAPRVGLDRGRRDVAMAKVRELATSKAPAGDRLGLWARLAAESGDRGDLLALLDLAGRNREIARAVATSSSFSECRWPGLIGPAIRLAGRSDEPRAFLDFAAFTATRDGREALLAYAADESNPVPERRRAIHRLKRDPAGVAFLLASADDPSRRTTIAAFFGRDHATLPGDPPPYDPRPTLPYARESADPSDPRPELRRLLADLGRMDDPWPRLLRDINNVARTPEARAAGLPNDDGDWNALDRANHVLDLLTVAAPTLDRSKAVPGGAWGIEGPPIAWRDWFAALDRFPDRAGHLDADFRLATLPPDCLPTLTKIAGSPTSPHRDASLRLLVARSERIEEVGPLIDTLSGRDPVRLSSHDAASLRALRRRFAVDFAWDTASWRSWWAAERGGR